MSRFSCHRLDVRFSRNMREAFGVRGIPALSIAAERAALQTLRAVRRQFWPILIDWNSALQITGARRF